MELDVAPGPILEVAVRVWVRAELLFQRREPQLKRLGILPGRESCRVLLGYSLWPLQRSQELPLIYRSAYQISVLG